LTVAFVQKQQARFFGELFLATGVLTAGMESDERLAARLKRGDLSAFDLLYERYEVPLFGFIRVYLSDTAEAEDVFHEAFMQVLRNAEADLSRFRSWLYATARNLCLNRLRARRRGRAAEQALSLTPHPSETPEQLYEQHKAQAALEGAVRRLPESLAELFHLRASGMSYEDMAEVLQLPLGTVKSRMHEMVRQLRKDMAPWTA
jgi:RNA polymerase sigma-70 factor (ECF subfamily)